MKNTLVNISMQFTFANFITVPENYTLYVPTNILMKMLLI